MKDDIATQGYPKEHPRYGVDSCSTEMVQGVDSEALLLLAVECNYDPRALAASIGTSRRQLQRAFRAALHCTPREWLREQRLLRAQQLLRAAPSVKQVAYALGFRHESQFCRDFRTRFGYSPSRELPTGTLRRLFSASQTAKKQRA